MRALELTSEEFTELGGEIMNRFPVGSIRKFERRWASYFAVDPIVVADVWRRLDIGKEDRFAEPKHLLWAILFLTQYTNETDLAGKCGAVHEDTFRKWTWHFIALIASLDSEVIVWGNRFVDDTAEDCLVTVDCTDCKMTKQGKSPKAFWSHKFRSSGLRYELAVCIKTGEIVWLHGPFPAGDWPDVNIFRHALKHYLGENERVEADDGYVGEDPKIIKTPKGVRFLESERVRSARGEARARHETCNNLVRQFGVLSDVFHHDIQKHGMCFRACAVLTQLSLELGRKHLYSVADIYVDTTARDATFDNIEKTC